MVLLAFLYFHLFHPQSRDSFKVKRPTHTPCQASFDPLSMLEQQWAQTLGVPSPTTSSQNQKPTRQIEHGVCSRSVEQL